MIKKLALVFLSGMLLAVSAQAAQVPRTEKDVPIYRGAARDSAAEAEAMAEYERFRADAGIQQGDEGLMVPRSTTIRVYTVATPAEDVLRFYLQALGGTEEDGADYLYSGAAAPGTVSPVYYQIHYVDFTVYTVKDARETKAELKQIRKPYTPDNWVSTADFAWKVGEKNADFTVFELTVVDDYFHNVDKNGNKKIKTSITIQKTTFMNPDDARQAAQDIDDDAEADEEFYHAETGRELAGTSFNPADLGISVYPGASYDAGATQFLKESMAVNGMAYQTDADARTVTAFYAKQSGFKQIHADEKGGLFKRCPEEYNEIMKRMMSTGECDAEITVQSPWMDMTTGRLVNTTLISIVNRGE